VYVGRPDGLLRFRWLSVSTCAELIRLTQTLTQRIGGRLERQRLLERNAENSYLAEYWMNKPLFSPAAISPLIRQCPEGPSSVCLANGL